MDKLYISEELQENSEHLKSLIGVIIKNNLRKGDIFELYPFNYFEDERTDYKGTIEKRHGKFIIESIDIKMIDSFNRNIRIERTIFLKQLNSIENI